MNPSTRLQALAAATAIALAAAPAVVANAQTIGQGTFVGASGHTTTGSVALTRSGGAYVIEFASNFSFDGAPDPKVGLGRNGTYDTSSTLAPLASNAGAQSYALPSSLDAESYNEIYVWCEQYSVPLGVARIK